MSTDRQTFADRLLDVPVITGRDIVQHSANTDRPGMSAHRLAEVLGVGDLGAIAPPSHDPYLATDEPTIAEAATLLSTILSVGAVARLDLLHDALTVAHRRGRASERLEASQLARSAATAFAAEAQRLADEHAERFAQQHAERGAAEAAWHALPWCDRVQRAGEQ